MNIVNVTTSKSYDVIIGNGLLQNAGSHILSIKQPCTVAVISNTTVWPLYGKTLSKSLTDSGFKVIHHAIGDSEAYKDSDKRAK